MNVKAVREGLIANLKTVLSDMQFSEYILSNPTPPSVVIVPGPAAGPQASQRGHEQRDFNVQVIVGLQSDVGAQKRLDDLLSEDSVTAALLVDGTLGGVVDDINVEGDSGYQQFIREGSGPPMLGVEYTVRVFG